MRKIQFPCRSGKSNPHYKHGMSKHPLNNIYNNVIRRCYDIKFNCFSYYGGRGVTVCDEWRNDRTKFFEWALNNGWTRELQIDRRNNDLGYSPENCRLVTRTVNMENRRCTKRLEYNGVVKTFKEWSENLGISMHLIRDRFKAGKSAEYILFEPKHRNK